MMMLLLAPVFLFFSGSDLPTQELDANKLTLANNELAFKLHNTFNSQGNTFCSPVSIFTALGMLYVGARGATAQQISHTLSYDNAGLSEKTINEHFKKLLLSFSSSSEQEKLEIANAMLSEIRYPVLSEYKEVLKNYYGALIKELNFAGETAEALDDINNWVNGKTHGKIPKLLEKLDPDTVLVLLNAVYFKGRWKTPFYREYTRKEKFYNDGVNGVSVQMMVQENYYFYGEFSEYGVKALKLPYVGEKVSMIIILPLQRNGLRTVEAKITSSILQNIITRLEYKNIGLFLPKFKLVDSKELKQNLITLGMSAAFTNQANFSGINREANLKVSKVVHKAMVEVNEEGTEAAGAVAAVGVPRAFIETSYFHVQHPFLFFIVNDRTRMILFFGRVNQL